MLEIKYCECSCNQANFKKNPAVKRNNIHPCLSKLDVPMQTPRFANQEDAEVGEE